MKWASRHERQYRKQSGATGKQIAHHLDGNRENDDPSNIVVLESQREHRRYHSPDWCKVDDQWWRRCKTCGVWYPLTDDYWYFRRSGTKEGLPTNRCKGCSRDRWREKEHEKRPAASWRGRQVPVPLPLVPSTGKLPCLREKR